MRRRNIGLAALLGIGAVAAPKAVEAAAPVAPADPFPPGTILWWHGDGPIPAGWASMDPPPVYVATQHHGHGGWYAAPANHQHTVTALPCHQHSVSDPGHCHGFTAADFPPSLRRIVRIV